MKTDLEKTPRSPTNMAVLLINDSSGAERYVAVPPGLTHAEAVSFVGRFIGTVERIAGFYIFT